MSCDPPPWLTIGKLSKATDIPVETIRTWERRYGVPSPARTPTNRRMYTPDVVEHLCLVKQAIDAGLRVGDVLKLEQAALHELVEVTCADPHHSPSHQDAVERALEQWLDAIKAYNADALRQTMQKIWFEEGILNFLDHYMGPLLTRIGEQWVEQKLGVRHEHFASEQIQGFLSSQWRSMMQGSTGAQVMCSTLPQERHQLGLHMVAVTAAMCGYRVLFLGANTPTQEILDAVHDTPGTRALFVSCASGANTNETVSTLEHLSGHLPAHCDLVAGGAGATAQTSSGWSSFSSFHDMAIWCAKRVKLT